MCYFFWVCISSNRFLDFSHLKENLMAVKPVTPAVSNMSPCSQIKLFSHLVGKNTTLILKKSLSYEDTQCLFCRIMFNIDQGGSWKTMNHTRYVSSAPYLGTKWSGITLGSRTIRDHQRDLQVFLYFFCMILVEIYPCMSGSVIKNTFFFNALVLRSFG